MIPLKSSLELHGKRIEPVEKIESEDSIAYPISSLAQYLLPIRLDNSSWYKIAAHLLSGEWIRHTYVDNLALEGLNLSEFCLVITKFLDSFSPEERASSGLDTIADGIKQLLDMSNEVANIQEQFPFTPLQPKQTDEPSSSEG